MPDTRVGKAIAAIYLLAALGSALVWVIQGAYSPALWLTVALTLPGSPLVVMVLYLVAMFLTGSSETVQTAVLSPLLVFLFSGLAVANVFVARAVCRACARRRLCRAGVVH